MNGQNGFSQSNNWFVGLGMKINDENLQGSVEKKNGNKDHQKMFHLSLSLIGKKNICQDFWVEKFSAYQQVSRLKCQH